jgi:muramoyltetrapeptide carboxypeptidase
MTGCAAALDPAFREPHPKPLCPPRLKSGDLIALAAPAGPFDRQCFDAGLGLLQAMGFRTTAPEAIFARQGYLAGTDRQRAEVLNRLFADPEVAGIVCARGGYGSTRMLPYLDLEAIRAHPKVFVGFSDITGLHAVLTDRCRLVTFHGPMAASLPATSEEGRAAFREALTGASPVVLAPAGGHVVVAGQARGAVAGGNLALLAHLVGTPYFPQLAGRILVLEDVDEAPYRIDRMLWQLRLAGVLTRVAGVVLGSFERCGAYEEIVGIAAAVVRPLGIPLVAGFPFGHGAVNFTLPLGLEACLTTDPPRLSFCVPATAADAVGP